MEITKERRLELVALILDILNNSNLLKSQSTSRQKIAKSAWGHVDQLLRVVERRELNAETRKEQFFQLVECFSESAKNKKINKQDLEKVQHFLQRDEIKVLTHDELRFVIGWIRRITVEE